MALDRPQALVLRALGLGDLLTAVPALRGVRAALPEHHVVLATPSYLEPLVRLTGAVDEVVDVSGLTPFAAPAVPDVAVNLHGRGPESHRLLRTLSPRRLVAFGSPEAGHDGPTWRADEHEVARWCRLVADSFDLAVDPGDLALAVPPATAVSSDPVADDAGPAGAAVPEGAVVVHPGAAFAGRRWPAERFALVCRRLAQAGHRVVVTGSDNEKALVARVVVDAGLPPAADLAGRLDLARLASLVARSRLVVCGDTGVAHLATAFGTPSVVLFGPVAPALWGPPDRPRHRVLWHGEGRAHGDPWSAELDPALALVTPDEVLDAAESLLAAPSP